MALADGPHTFGVRATDPAGNTGSASAHTWTIDTVAPATAITAQPSNPDRSSSATIAFESTDTDATFACRIDAGSWAPCTSPHAYAGLADGPHRVDVRATDPTGNTGPTATIQWTVDTIGPGTAIDGPRGLTNETDAVLTLTSPDPTATFECRIDEQAWEHCTSPLALSGLAEGDHTADVRATDPAGNTGAAASLHWTIDTTAPAVAFTGATPNDPTSRTTATLRFASAAPAATFACKLDAEAWAACSSPAVYADLADGPHTFSVRPTDPAGNTGPAATHTWTVDTRGPQTALTEAPSGFVSDADPTFAFEADRTVAGYDCRVDSAPWAACTSRFSVHLEDGIHTFAVRAHTAAGVTELDGPVRSFVVDTTAPVTEITSAPSGTVGAGPADVEFTANEPVTRYDCSLDGAAFERCSSPLTTDDLGAGRHTFAVRATDRAQNVEQAAVRTTWTVKADDPAPAPSSGSKAAGADAPRAAASTTPVIKTSKAARSTPTTLHCASEGHTDASAVTYQWLRSGQPIPGATSIDYLPQPRDRPERLTCAVTYSYADAPADVVVTDPVVTLGRTVLHTLQVHHGARTGLPSSAEFTVNHRTAVLIRIWCRRASGNCPRSLPPADRQYGRATRDVVSPTQLTLIARRVVRVRSGSSKINLRQILREHVPAHTPMSDLYVSARVAKLDPGTGRITGLSAFLSHRLDDE